jgi:hypothetical protein
MIGEQADGDLRLQPPLLGEPALPEPVSASGMDLRLVACGRSDLVLPTTAV